MVKVLSESQMWQGFLCEREEWKKNGILESCVLIKEAKSIWCVEDLNVSCSKCHQQVHEGLKIKKGSFYCATCFEKSHSRERERK